MEGQIKKTPAVLVLLAWLFVGLPWTWELRSFGRMHANYFNHLRQLLHQWRRGLRQRLPRQAAGDESWFHLLCRFGAIRKGTVARMAGGFQLKKCYDLANGPFGDMQCLSH